MKQACAVYEGLLGGGRYVAWRIDPRSIRVRIQKRPTPQKIRKVVHWTRQRGMVERGVEQPKLDTVAEVLLEKFGRAMVASGHRSDQAAQHKDRLRYCARVLKHHSVVPPSSRTEETRQKIKSLPKNKELHGHLFCSFNWFVKYVEGVSLKPRTVTSVSKPSFKKRKTM